jgi:hypothetical protein
VIAASVASRGEPDKATDHLARRWRKITEMLGELPRRSSLTASVAQGAAALTELGRGGQLSRS